jgi:hypothetical protein
MINHTQGILKFELWVFIATVYNNFSNTGQGNLQQVSDYLITQGSQNYKTYGDKF